MNAPDYELRQREDQWFAQLMQNRAEMMRRRAEQDLAVVERAHDESLGLLAEAEGLHTQALSQADGLRGLLYRRLGCRGKRPTLLVQLDELEHQARDAKRRAEEANRQAGELVGWARQVLIRP